MRDLSHFAPDSLSPVIAEEDWLALATNLADVGRWVYDAETAQCHIDDVLLALTGLTESQPMDARAFIGCIHPDDLPEVERALAEAVRGNTIYETSFRFIRPDGQTIWLKGKGRSKILPDGRQAVIGVNYDVSDLQNAIIANRLLAAEMAHRVKNMISLASGMFRMAQRTATDSDALATAYIGRLDALSALNELIFESEGRCVTTSRLFSHVFEPLMTDARVNLSVGDFRLNGTSAQTLMLAINELMTNAIKYGALNEEGGRLDVAIRTDAGADTFDLIWEETMPTEITPPDTSGGFGMNVLTRMTKHTFDGDPRIEWRPDGLRFSCRWRASEMAGAPTSLDHEQRLFEEAERATTAVQNTV